MSKKIKNATDISPKVRQEVIERDKVCIICGDAGQDIAHFISRARLGLGIPENLGYMCRRCHYNYDNGKLHYEIKNAFKDHLCQYYDDWSEDKIIYKKWSDFNNGNE